MIYILFSTDRAQTYKQELKIKDDRIDGEHKIMLEFDGLKKI